MPDDDLERAIRRTERDLAERARRRRPPDPPAGSRVGAAGILVGCMAAMGLSGWLADFGELQIGLSLCGGLLGGMLLAGGITGWHAKARFAEGAEFPRLGAFSRAVLIVLGLGSLVASFAAVRTLV